MSAKLRSPEYLVALVCVAQVFVQIGSAFWMALLPSMMAQWQLSNSEAGWITAIFFGAYMVSVPVLVTLTDRLDTRSVYLFGVGLTIVGHVLFSVLADGFWSALCLRALTGVGWAGTYMTGLKLLADKVEGKLMSRATAGHAASIGVSGALSFTCAELVANLGGWRVAFFVAGMSATIAWLLVVSAFPRTNDRSDAPTTQHALFDFRPVFRNRSAMAYALTYCIHTFEFHAVRGWGVVFLVFVAGTTGSEPFLSPPFALTLLGLIATVTSCHGQRSRDPVRSPAPDHLCADRLGNLRGAARYGGTILVSFRRCCAAHLRRFHFAGFIVADGGICGQCRSGPPRCNARRPFHAGLRGRVLGPASCRLHTRSGWWQEPRWMGLCLSDRCYHHGLGPHPIYRDAARGLAGDRTTDKKE